MRAAQQELVQIEHRHVKNIAELPFQTSRVGRNAAQVVIGRYHGEARASKFAAGKLVGERLRAPRQADRLKGGFYLGPSGRVPGKEERRKACCF